MRWLFHLFCVPSYRQHIPHTHTHTHTMLENLLKRPGIHFWVSQQQWCCIKNELSLNVEVSGARLERLIGRDACDISFCFPTAEVTCCCGSTDAWRVRGLCYARMCILTRYPLLRLEGLSLSIWSLVGVTCFKMSSQFSHFINTKKTQQHQLTALFWELMPCLWKQSGTAP